RRDGAPGVLEVGVPDVGLHLEAQVAAAIAVVAAVAVAIAVPAAVATVAAVAVAVAGGGDARLRRCGRRCRGLVAGARGATGGDAAPAGAVFERAAGLACGAAGGVAHGRAGGLDGGLERGLRRAVAALTSGEHQRGERERSEQAMTCLHRWSSSRWRAVRRRRSNESQDSGRGGKNQSTRSQP